MKCKVTYHGAGSKLSIHLGTADRRMHFRESSKTISIELDGAEGYTTLQRDFFGHVGQIRTIYPTRDYWGINLLIDWLNDNKLTVGDEVELEIIVPFKKYRLKKV
jgi:hypothetical protein